MTRENLDTYGWWFRNPANQLRLVVYPIIYKVLYIPSGAGFFPSTVVIKDGQCFHTLYLLPCFVWRFPDFHCVIFFWIPCLSWESNRYLKATPPTRNQQIWLFEKHPSFCLNTTITRIFRCFHWNCKLNSSLDYSLLALSFIYRLCSYSYECIRTTGLRRSNCQQVVTILKSDPLWQFCGYRQRWNFLTQELTERSKLEIIAGCYMLKYEDKYTPWN